MSGVGRVLPGRRGVPFPHGSGAAASVPGRAHLHGLHPHGPVPHAPARPHPRRAVLPAHLLHTHEQPQPQVGAGAAGLTEGPGEGQPGVEALKGPQSVSVAPTTLPGAQVYNQAVWTSLGRCNGSVRDIQLLWDTSNVGLRCLLCGESTRGLIKTPYCRKL